jgi:hypothetical protein
MSAFHDNALLGASGQQGYKISRSVRLRSSASAYFNRTPASAGNRKTWTWSGWIKRGALSTRHIITQAEAGGNTNAVIEFLSDQIRIFQQVSGTDTFYLITTQVFRDPSAWYHIVVVLDTTQATNTNRLKLYVNGVQVTSFSSSLYPSLNFDGSFNSNIAQYIGAWLNATAYSDGYLTEIQFIDGQALTPSSFGETDTTTGVWKPKKYTGTYGTNGFYLNFSDNSSNTATTIGKDNSGNGNNWTPNNISVTSGVTYDSMIDVPTLYADGGNGRGNYPTINPLAITTYPGTYANGNLQTTTPSVGGGNTYATMALPASGKYYWEVLCQNSSLSSCVGVASYNPSETYLYNNTNAVQLYFNGQKYVDGTASAYGSAMGSNALIGIAADCDSGSITFYINNASQGAISHTMSGLFPVFSDGSSGAGEIATFNFGQRPFSYTPPTGFVALNTQNLPTPTISNGANYMNASLWTGDASTPRAVVSNLAFSPDLVWTKDRSVGYQHSLQDTVRGTGASKKLYSSLTEGENGANSVYGHINSFDSNGFTVATGSSGAQHVNASGVTYVGWSWKAGVSAVTNTSGSITSTVDAGATQGFSVVTYTGTGANATVGHGLGVAPQMVIVKCRSNTSGWVVGSSYMTSWSYFMQLNSTVVQTLAAAEFNGTAPTSSVFSVGTDTDTNGSARTYVAYCFAAVAGYSAFGKYTGNGSTDGPFVYLGFRPRFVITKSADATAGVGDWTIHDTSRLPYNTNDLRLFANASSAESSSEAMDMLANGFKIRATNSNCNTSGGGYIYMAFAENPFKNSLAR